MTHRHHHIHAFLHRTLHCLILISVVLVVGTLAMHFLEGFRYIDAFYFTSMIATGQGPAPMVNPTTVLGKLFTCMLAFVCTGTMIASLGYLFGPVAGRLWKFGVLKVEEEIDHLKGKK